MGRYMSRSNRENQYLTRLQHQLSNMEEETILWYGVVWGGEACKGLGKDECRTVL